MLKHYKFGNPEGRFIGMTENLAVYADSIMRRDGSAEVDREIRKSEGGDLWFDYGPSTGGLIESVGMRFLTPGETISEVKVEPFFKKRELEIRGKTVEDAILTVERINGFHAASHSIAFSSALEDALGIETDPETTRSRIVMMELERIRSNLEVVKRLCEPAGFGTPYNQVGYLRERVSRLIGISAGHRYFFASNGVGRADISVKDNIPELESTVSEFSRIYDGLMQSKIFLNRLQGNGVTSTDHLVGPAARAAEKKVDARLDSPTLGYGKHYSPVIREESDSFGRFMVRCEEVQQSLEIIKENAVDSNCKAGTPDLSGSGTGAARVESPQGDLFYYVEVSEGRVIDLEMLSPSAMNVIAFEESMKGNIFTDFHFNWESFGIWISELGVDIR